MRDQPDAVARRAQRLLRCYPRSWRSRYGEEFTQLLIDEMSDRPYSAARAADVIRGGLVARLAGAGLAGDALGPVQQLRYGLAVVGCAVVAFLLFGVAIWSQLTIGWQWSAPAAPATDAAMVVMSGACVVFVVLALLAALPLAGTLLQTLARHRARALVWPLALAAVGAAVLIVGSVHVGRGWPGTGGHPWSGRDIVPSAVARFCWAATLWITSYWAHPGALSQFPALEIAWMVASPIALLAGLVGVATAVRRLPLSPRVLRYEAWLGAIATLAMAGFLAGASSWVVSGGPAPRGLFRVGTIDSVGLALMAAMLVLAFRAAHRALGARLGALASR